MIESLKNWWLNHKAGERWLMAVLGIAILIVLLWLGIWRPVNDGIAAGWARQGAALERYGAVRSKVEALKRLPAKPGGAAVPVEQLVTQSAAEAGFTLDRVGSPGAGRMSVSIGAARSAPLLAWLARLEESGVTVQTISITPGSADGTVAVQAMFQGRAQ